MKTKQAQEIRPVAKVDQVLVEDDVKLLERREAIKAELKRLDDYLKPKIASTIDSHGDGRLMIGNRQIELKRSVRNSIAWKPLAYSLVPEEVILSVQDSFTEPYNVDSVKVIS